MTVASLAERATLSSGTALASRRWGALAIVAMAQVMVVLTCGGLSQLAGRMIAVAALSSRPPTAVRLSTSDNPSDQTRADDLRRGPTCPPALTRGQAGRLTTSPA